MARGLNTFIITVVVLVGVTSALRMIRRPGCANGISGICRGGKCTGDSYCSPASRGRLRLCCRNKPRPNRPNPRPAVICRFGSLGSCGGKDGPCKGGVKCTTPKGSKDGRGQCCRPKPVIAFPDVFCPHGSFGPCGGKSGAQCKGFVKCSLPIGKPNGEGKCCKPRPILFPGVFCPHGSTGSCGGKAGAKCKNGIQCTLPIGSKNSEGQCCRPRPSFPDLPIPIGMCKYGSHGPCNVKTGPPCKNGATCQLPRGVKDGQGQCCKSRPDRPPGMTCPYGSLGSCGGFFGPQCRDGIFCTTSVPGGLGQCCRPKPDITFPGVFCRYGSFGDCGGKKGLQCSNGIKCTHPRGVVDGLGQCCKPRPSLPGPSKDCLHGSLGFCAGKNGSPCKGAGVCTLSKGKSVGVGECCRKNPGPVLKPKGICPPPSPRVGICVVDPKTHCLNDKACPEGELCCSEGCGRTCKKPLRFPPKLPMPA